MQHRAAAGWFERDEPTLATCPGTEGTQVRFLLREGVPAAEAMGGLEAVRRPPWHEFWLADVPYNGRTSSA